MAGEGAVRSPGRKRTHSGAGSNVAARLVRVHALSATARELAPNPRYLEELSRRAGSGNAPLITERQREKVVKYINELAEDFELLVQTGGLACNYFDRFVASLAAKAGTYSGRRPNIQMIASTCLLIASKFFDRKLPPLSELEKVHHGNVRADEFAEQELQILSALRWKLHVPLPHVFMEHLKALCVGAPCDPAIEDRMLFFIDLSVYGYRFLEYPPCAIAAAAIVTAWKFSDKHEVVAEHLPTLARACELDREELLACINSLVRYYQVCFPDAAKGSQSLFVPIPAAAEEDVSRGASPADSSASTDVEMPDGSISPDVATASRLAAHDGPTCPGDSRGGGAVSAPSPALCPSPSAGEMGETAAAASAKYQLDEQTDRADTPDTIVCPIPAS